ncbi:hypothetical protein LTR56_002712 [Elasticomyces elasticus]|nr:hypothetical protein LTR56_002712 [Elasticomyces elasticus]
MDFKDLPQFRPAEIKTYHSNTYDRISPSTTKFDAKGKTVLITAGARIIILQRRESVLAAAKEALEEAYPNTKVETYSASQSDFQRMTEIIQSVGEIDVLIPCATYAGDMKPPTKDKNTEELAEVYMVNVVGLFHMVREFLALPATASGGPKSVIHVSSNASQMYFPGGSGYCSSKAAANQIITHFGFDDPNGNVKFYSLHPGAVWTALAEENVPQDAVVWEDIKLPGDFAVWLAGPEATFLNGRFVWAAWDVDELIAMTERVASDPNLLTITLAK